MLNIKLAGADLYQILSWFFLYSFFGWLFESCYVSVKEKALINRGYIKGPFCTIYGCGAVLVYLILRPVSGSLLLLFFGGMAVATVLEYVTAVVMEKIFHTSWWSYHDKKFNFQGRICLGSSVAWGAFSVILFKVLHPAVTWIVSLYPVYAGKIIVAAVSAAYLIDFAMATANALSLRDRLRSLEEVKDEISAFLQSTRLYETTGEIKARLYYKELKENIELRISEGMAQLKLKEYKKEISERMSELNNKYAALKSRNNGTIRRFLKSYPHLKISDKRNEPSKKEKEGN